MSKSPPELRDELCTRAWRCKRCQMTFETSEAAEVHARLHDGVKKLKVGEVINCTGIGSNGDLYVVVDNDSELVAVPLNPFIRFESLCVAQKAAGFRGYYDDELQHTIDKLEGMLEAFKKGLKPKRVKRGGK